MTSSEILRDSFYTPTYTFSGNGARNVNVLKEAFENIDGNQVSDIYGSGEIIDQFQEKIASLLGKEAAIFFPSGTMAQQIALRVWCDEKGIKKVAYHPLSHLELHEHDGLKELHHIETILLADKNRVIEFTDIENLSEEVSCILLELPQREIGGQLPSLQTLQDISAYCQQKGIKLHLDGARLLEVLPYYQKTASEICELFDSVYISFYKGIGGIAGAILAGEKEFLEKTKVWKQRYGGNLISLYPYIISADYHFNKRAHKMGQYYEHAKELASFFNACPDIKTVPDIPVSNMFHVHINRPKEEAELLLSTYQTASNIAITPYVNEIDSSICSFELSIGDVYESLPKEDIHKAFDLLSEIMKKH